MIQQLPVGSLCVHINGDGRVYPEFIGKEVTILTPLAMHFTKNREGEVAEEECYEVEVQGYEGQIFVARHVNLKLKRFPGELYSKCEEFMKTVLKPVNVDEKESV